MSTLSRDARQTIRDHGLPVAVYVRDVGRWVDGKWHGDSCGCTDDRCIGHHHDVSEECGCLPALIRYHLEDQAAAAASQEVGA